MSLKLSRFGCRFGIYSLANRQGGLVSDVRARIEQASRYLRQLAPIALEWLPFISAASAMPDRSAAMLMVLATSRATMKTSNNLGCDGSQTAGFHLLFLSPNDLRMTQCSHKRESPDEVAHQGRKEELHNICSPGDVSRYKQKKRCSRSCDDVVKSTDSYQISHNYDDADSRRFCAGKKPYHQCDQPTRENGSHKHCPETYSNVGGANLCQTLLGARIEDADSSDAQSEQECSNKIRAQYHDPQTKHAQQCGQIFP